MASGYSFCVSDSPANENIGSYFNIAFVLRFSFGFCACCAIPSIQPKFYVLNAQGLLEILSAASEFDDIPVRPGEEDVVRRLLTHAPVAVDKPRFTDPHVKANALLQVRGAPFVIPWNVPSLKGLCAAAASGLGQRCTSGLVNCCSSQPHRSQAGVHSAAAMARAPATCKAARHLWEGPTRSADCCDACNHLRAVIHCHCCRRRTSRGRTLWAT